MFALLASDDIIYLILLYLLNMSMKKAVIGKNITDTKRKRFERAVKMSEQCEVRLELNWIRDKQWREAETSEKDRIRLESNLFRE